MFISKVCRAFDKAKVSYAIVGGYAVALHGAVRGTVDIDVALRWSLKNLEEAEKALRSLGLVSLLPIDAKSLFNFRSEYIKNRHLIAWNFYDPKNPANQVDIVITFDLHNKATVLKKTVFGPFKVLAKSELIAMKKEAGRPQDLEDITALESL